MKTWSNGEQVFADDLNSNFLNLGGKIKFGGTGANGSLAISSGTTTVNLGGVLVYVLNYSSISITGTAKLAFSNPNANGTLISIKSQGNITLTSNQTPMIYARNCGVAGGAGVAVNLNSATSVNGASGNDSNFHFIKCNKGVGGTYPTTGGAVGILATDLGALFSALSIPATKFPTLFVGAGATSGGGTCNTGGSAVGTSGVGGTGGGALVIECAGELNFTTANGLSCAGGTGGNASGTTSGTSGIGGGGGGGGGLLIVLYNVLVDSSGTVATTASGGTGLGSPSGGSAGCGGSGGGSAFNAGASIGTGAKNGADGGAGSYYIGLNNDLG